MHKDLAKAAKLIGVELSALEEASVTSERLLSGYTEKLTKKFSKDPPNDYEMTDIVLCGSIAREECSFQSDCDYYVLQNGASARTTRKLIETMQEIEVDFPMGERGGQNVFGGIVVAPNLYENIGLESDTNANMTRRILLLSESKPVTSGETYKTAINNILERYCADYLPPNRNKSDPAQVPRYLLNDLVRYWRTMAVDFGTKRWRNDDSNLRLAKLRITRKILFAGPLATVLLTGREERTNDQLIDYLTKSLAAPPLAQIAKHFESMNNKSQSAMRVLLQDYDQFIGILSGHKRDVLKCKRGDSKSREEVKGQCKAMGDRIQSSLEQIFYKDNLFKNTFQKYAVF
ncbi:MAG: hypothetical protein WBC05_01460 [Sedimentisphaerales bacterium]